MEIIKITVKRFRSINNLTINFNNGIPLVICGSNNVGKTNFLRALDLFFSMDTKKFDVKNDIPYDIEEGKRGAGRNVRFEAIFMDKKDKYKIITTYKHKDKQNKLEINGSKNGTEINEEKIEKIVKQFKFLFVEASNIDIPQIIDHIVDFEVLKVGLDALRKKQSKPLEHLNKFIKESQNSVKGIEKEVKKILDEFIQDVPGINTDGWEIKILFPEYQKLREALTGMIDFTLYDKNKRKMESKGSGIQRTVLLSLMKYITQQSNKNIIWGIDEPEAFLQPALQKKTFNVLKELSQEQNIIMTTHSQYFVDIRNVKNTYLFKADYEEKEFVRKQGETFYKVNTFIESKQSDLEKICEIKKHLGISKNDGWEIHPFNLLVEGEEDKNYILSLLKLFNIVAPNILTTGGVDKTKGYLEFLHMFCEELDYKPKILCLFDFDNAGKKVFNSLKNKNYKYFDYKQRYINRFDGQKDKGYDYEIEDFIPPEIFIDSVNKFLRKRKYKIIKKKDLEDRNKLAYNKKCILNFITARTKQNNSAKSEINFEGNLGAKKIFCEYTCRYLETKKEDTAKIFNKYSKIKDFLEKINSN